VDFTGGAVGAAGSEVMGASMTAADVTERGETGLRDVRLIGVPFFFSGDAARNLQAFRRSAIAGLLLR
jgi:hypothetical protein